MFSSIEFELLSFESINGTNKTFVNPVLTPAPHYFQHSITTGDTPVYKDLYATITCAPTS